MSQLAPGARVRVREHMGYLRYLGPTSFAAGTWAGIELDDAVGRNDGSVRAVRYFSCANRRGLFVQPNQLRIVADGADDEASDEQLVVPKIDVDAGAATAESWNAIEQQLELEALERGKESARVLAHLESVHPQPTLEAPQQAPLLVRRRSSAQVVKLLNEDAHFVQLIDKLPLPADYMGPTLEHGKAPTLADMKALLSLIKHRYCRAPSSVSKHVPVPQTPAVPQSVAMRILLLAKSYLAKLPNMVDLKLEKGRVVIVGDTHGQLADFCWLLRSHGEPSMENIYVINGDIADRGPDACEILILALGYMIAAPGAVYLNRGNHESLDMNVRTFGEGGGFSQEVGSKYDSATFTLFQQLFNTLPIATRINGEVLVVHGGLSRVRETTLEQMQHIDRRQRVPVGPCTDEDVRFFDFLWSDPKKTNGVGTSGARGANCITFGPDLTRRFCEKNRLRMIVRSHEVPKSLSGVEVQHDGRLITIFSASNYCGRIGNTGGTMLLTPQLDYQLMEHWAPSLPELLDIEAAEDGDRAVPLAEEPSKRRASLQEESTKKMRADVLLKMKELICERKSALLDHFARVDAGGDGCVSRSAWSDGLAEVVNPTLPWADYFYDLVDGAAVSPAGHVRYATFVSRYRVRHAHEDWQAQLFSKLHDALTGRGLKETLAFFDTNEDGLVTMDELLAVLHATALGVEESGLQSIARDLLRGKEALKTSSLLTHFNVQYRDQRAAAGKPVRSPPQWAMPMLNAVASQCAMRKRDATQLFRSFDSNGDGMISYAEFETALRHLAGPEFEALEDAAKSLKDLAEWIDIEGDGHIDYMDFLGAFLILEPEPHDGEPSAEEACDAESVNILDRLREQLCAVFYYRKWSFKTAFEYFDTNGDGGLSTDEFKQAMRALTTLPMDGTEAHKQVRFTDEQISRLAESLDRNGDGIIDYEEFLETLSVTDANEA